MRLQNGLARGLGHGPGPYLVTDLSCFDNVRSQILSDTSSFIRPIKRNENKMELNMCKVINDNETTRKGNSRN